MAICRWCYQEMSGDGVDSCKNNESIIFPDGETLAAVPFKAHDSERCHDCNIADGGFHHPGCDMERCPRCNGQLIGCGCLDDGRDDDE